MTQTTHSPENSPADLAAQERARLGWQRLRRQITKIAPSDLAHFSLVTLAIAFLLWVFIASWPALAPFVAGGVIAYVLLPFVNTLDRLLPRPIAALITLAGFFTLIFMIIGALAPAIAQQSLRLYANSLTAEKVQEARQLFSEYLQNQPEPLRTILRDYIGLVGAQLQARIDVFFNRLAANNINVMLRLVNTFSVLIGLLVLPLWILAVLTGQRRTVNAIRSLVPDWMEADFWAVIRIIDRTMSAFLRGQLLLGLAVGFVFYLELNLLSRLTTYQIQYPILAALLVGILQLIPQIGPLIGILLIFILSLPAGIQFTVIIIGLYIAAQFIVNQLVASRVNRRVIDLNPAVLAVFITVLSQFGLIWLLLSAPILSISRDLFRYAYSRFGDPPRPAGVLPGETVSLRPATARLPNTSVEGSPPPRRERRTVE